MKYGLSQDARPQATTLLLAAGLSIALWFVALDINPDDCLWTYQTDGGRIVEFADRNSIHLFRGHRPGNRAPRRRAFCQRARRDFCVEPASRAMRAERPAGFENSILSFV